MRAEPHLTWTNGSGELWHQGELAPDDPRGLLCAARPGGPHHHTTPRPGQATAGQPARLLLPRRIQVSIQTGPLPCRGLIREITRQQSYAIKNQLGYPKPPIRGFGTQNTPICASLVLYGIRVPIIGPFRAWKPTILGLWMPELVLYGIRLLAK